DRLEWHLLAFLDNARRQRRPDAGQALQFLRRRLVDVDWSGRRLVLLQRHRAGSRWTSVRHRTIVLVGRLNVDVLAQPLERGRADAVDLAQLLDVAEAVVFLAILL